MIEIKFKCDKCNNNKGTIVLDDHYEPHIECSKCGHNESLYLINVGSKEE
jgi:Zn ribbon nucleic-acid-binding protein